MTREEELKELKYREQKKVVWVTDRDGKGFWDYCECPTCRGELDDIACTAYCPYCGQRLDWRITEKDLVDNPIEDIQAIRRT